MYVPKLNWIIFLIGTEVRRAQRIWRHLVVGTELQASFCVECGGRGLEARLG